MGTAIVTVVLLWTVDLPLWYKILGSLLVVADQATYESRLRRVERK